VSLGWTNRLAATYATNQPVARQRALVPVAHFLIRQVVLRFALPLFLLGVHDG